MSRLTRNLRITVLKGMEALGTSASNLASNAKQKVVEINLETRRREILTDFSLQAFELWQKGVQLPESLSAMLTELSDIEGRLSILRAEKYAKVNGGNNGGGEGNGEAPAAQSEEAVASAENMDAKTETCAESAEEGQAVAAEAAQAGAQPNVMDAAE